MTTSNKLSILGIALVALTLSGCKKIGKEVSERIARESLEEAAEAGTKKEAKNLFEELSSASIKKLSSDGFQNILKKEFPKIYASFSRLDKSVQRDFAEHIKENPRALDRMLSSSSVIDEYIAATSKLPNLARNASFFAFYITHPQFTSAVELRESNDAIELVSKDNDKVLAKYKDGVVNVIEPFAEGTSAFGNELLKTDLLPNTLYKVKGEKGKTYHFQTDKFGNVTTVEAKNISVDELITNIIRRTDDVNLGKSWAAAHNKLMRHSRGDDLTVTVNLKYSDGRPSPVTVKVTAKRDGKEIMSTSFDNANHMAPRHYTAEQNAKLLAQMQKKTALTPTMSNILKSLMDADDGFAEFIHNNPDYNIKRWLKANNPVDASLIKRSADGNCPPNAEVYAGNVFYFNPYLNPQLANKLNNKAGKAALATAGITEREQLDELDRVYRDGVPYSKSGYPDFSGVAAKGTDNRPIIIDIGALTGDSQRDISLAETMYLKLGNQADDSYTWHQVEGTTYLMRVPATIHGLIDQIGCTPVTK